MDFPKANVKTKGGNGGNFQNICLSLTYKLFAFKVTLVQSKCTIKNKDVSQKVI